MFQCISADPDGKYFVPTGQHHHPHCVHKHLQFYSWLVCWLTMLHMSVGTPSHLQYFIIALIDLKIHVISVVCFQDDQEFNPTASFLWKSTSGTFHLKILSCRIHGTTVVRSGKEQLGISNDHNFSSWSHWQLISDSFLLAGSWKKW